MSFNRSPWVSICVQYLNFTTGHGLAHCGIQNNSIFPLMLYLKTKQKKLSHVWRYRLCNNRTDWPGRRQFNIQFWRTAISSNAEANSRCATTYCERSKKGQLWEHGPWMLSLVSAAETGKCLCWWNSLLAISQRYCWYTHVHQHLISTGLRNWLSTMAACQNGTADIHRLVWSIKTEYLGI